MKKFLIGFAGLALIAIAAFVLMPEHADEAAGLEKAETAEARVVEKVSAGKGDRLIQLDAANSTVHFSCAKELGGKTIVVRGGWSGDFESRIAGEALVSGSGELRSIKLEFQVETLWSEHPGLTTALKTKGFFDLKGHPVATFVSTAIKPAEGLSNATHQVEGNFKLNGIEKSITVPVVIQSTDDRFQLDTAFSLNRKEFNCNFVDDGTYGLLTDDNIAREVALKMKIDARTGAGATQGKTGSAEQIAAQPLTAAEIAALPAGFKETIPATQVSFDMVLVPGDTAAQIPPYFIGKREVTWDEFMPWMICEDVADKEEHGILRAKNLRPSVSYIDVTRGYGSSGYPALSMSRFSAELYCKWLSAQTGRRYRLPTEAEWRRAWTLGGGTDSAYASDDEGDAVAIFAFNSFDDFDGKSKSRKVGSKAANGLGLFDMAGNVAEWISGEQRAVMGGHYMAPYDQIGAVSRLVETPEWNLNYPNEPKSIWWFVDAEWTGIRLICEPASGFKAP